MHNGQQIWGARGEGLSGLEGLLKYYSSSGSWGDDGRYQDWYRYGEIEGEFQILGAATLKLRAPDDVRTDGAERRLVLESLKERVEWQACKDERR